ncbi:EF-hand domain-containing family member B [Drosophila ficusphila]|uniref:EF-hand domain-containing family member B n=1 Tax=Drosophila ficusphila TaxID=30025 RepID=UPI0007E6794A|nr:EF-hand domain-containing family member B [Drosophila ficusphila]
MANKGHFVDRNLDIPTAGLSTIGLDGEGDVAECLSIKNPADLAESFVRAKCKEKLSKSQSSPSALVMPSCSIRDLMTSELQKSLFVSFKEKLYEELYFKKAKLGNAKETHSKPESVTNFSQTFGRAANPTHGSNSLYTTIMPPKSPKEVNQEYQKFHDKYIISHNHYFPSEQVNRGYSKPFDSKNPCGEIQGIDNFGHHVKSCLEEGENHLKVIGKAQVEFMNRTEAPLGSKFKKYPYEVPDITFGIPLRSNGDVKMLLNNSVDSDKTNRLLDAISYLNKNRQRLRKRLDFDMQNFLSLLERNDKDKTGYLPLRRILEIIAYFHFQLDAQKIRDALSHFKMIVDEGCATERVNYMDFIRLLSIQEPLPEIGNLASASEVHDMNTTYRLLCDDYHKKPKDTGKPKDNQQLEEDTTSMKDLINPDFTILRGLNQSDFTRLRPKAEIERIFGKLVTKDKFELIWQSLMVEHNDQNEMASVNQFRSSMLNEIKTK